MYSKCLREGIKTPNFADKANETGFAGVGRNNVFEYLLFGNAFGKASKHRALMSFPHKLVNLGFQGWAGTTCIWISSIWNAFGKASKHRVLHIKLANRDLWRRAWKTYLNIFYLNRLWQGVNTSSFGHNIGESELSGAGRNTIYVNIFYLKCLWEAPKHQVLQIKLENLAFQECSWILYLNTFYLKCLWEAPKHRVLHIKR